MVMVLPASALPIFLRENKMTYIEFFEEVSIENVCACIACPPEKVILVGSNGDRMRQYSRAYQSLLSSRGHSVSFEVKTVNPNDLNAIYRLLCEITDDEENISIGLNGGGDLFILASGMLYERNGYIPKIHRFNLKKGIIYDLHKDGRVESFDAPPLTVEEIVSLYGGVVYSEEEKRGGTYRWELTEDFCRDIEFAWNICKVNTKTWNNFINTLGFLRDNRGESEGVRISCRIDILERAMEAERNKPYYSDSLMNRLKAYGLVTEYSRGDVYSVTFKNEQVMRMLTVAGLALELKVFTAASFAEKFGKKVYDSVLNGVCIDWDGRVHDHGESYDTENEIDVMLTRGGIPTFISCKNGFFDANELYKLSSVAQRFGGEYAKKVLVASSLKKLGNSAGYILERARDMDITVIDGVAEMSSKEIVHRIANL